MASEGLLPCKWLPETSNAMLSSKDQYPTIPLGSAGGNITDSLLSPKQIGPWESASQNMPAALASELTVTSKLRESQALLVHTATATAAVLVKRIISGLEDDVLCYINEDRVRQ